MVFFQLRTEGLISQLCVAIRANHRPFLSTKAGRITCPFSHFLCSVAAQPESCLYCRYIRHLAQQGANNEVAWWKLAQ